ncbi:DUF4828 domain-containing protein [Enterococcus saccharolyticus]|uniref:DUF4828 domain-containing protein n=1 Tax=Enterococcus saccharolyticus TaxID=41997 RepID=UPI0039E05111
MNARVLLLGISLVTGIVGSTLIRRKKTTDSKQHPFVGSWVYLRQNKKGKVYVTVTTDLQLYIQNKLQPTTVLDYSTERLALIDSMGYHIVFEKKDEHVNFYDETEDTSFPLIEC